MSSFYTIKYSKTIHKFAYITAYATPSTEVCGKIPPNLKRGFSRYNLKPSVSIMLWLHILACLIGTALPREGAAMWC